MHITEKISQAGGKTLISFEILPPSLGRDYLNELFVLVEDLITMSPAFINITYHSRQQKKMMKVGKENVLVPVKKRPGTIGICAAIKTRFNMETVPHLICTDHDAHEIEDKLIELNYLGIDNILALRGDKLKHEQTYTPKPGGYRYAVDMVRQVVNMNQGNYLDEYPGVQGKTDFCIGVAGYPEKHVESSVSHQQELQYLKEKIDAGAHYIVTQMFFDNRVYFNFVEDCRQIGINVPIIPGIKNLTKASQVKGIAKIFGASMPKELIDAFASAKNPEEEKSIGTQWCIKQSKELKKSGAPVIHYYTMGHSEEMKKIVEAIFPENLKK